MSHAIPLGRSVEVSVPATTANLGPGFDTLGMALTMGDRLSATVVEGTGITVEVHGVGEGEVPTDETNLIAKSLLHAFAAKGVTAPGLHLVAHNTIPHGRGLGSSGAAIVAGVMAAKGLLEGFESFDASELLAIATEMEGHPDNIAPSLFGGLTIAWMTDQGPKHKKAQRPPRSFLSGGRSPGSQHVDPIGKKSAARYRATPGRDLQPVSIGSAHCCLDSKP